MLKDTWKTIRDAIDGDIRAGVFAPGDQLPTEPELAKRFGAGRHSVRRAVAELAVAGKLRVEQGRGTFVEDAPRLTYTIGKRTRLRDNLTSQGVDVSREFLSADMVDAGAGVAEALRIGAADKVIRSTFLTSADGMPIAFGSSFHAAARFPDYIARRNVFGSVTETYRSFGI
ncbi:MAG: GntR family transcriptional regulator, partial [Pseudomonadota bacterium]